MPRFLASDRVQAAIAAVAARQHGVITTAQVLSCGLTSPGITNWVRAGRLHRVHRGVYAVGHPGISLEGEWMAAVLACGPAAVLSDLSAAMLWRMLEPRSALIHVTVRGGGGRARREGLVIHRRSTLPPGQSTARDDIPVTSTARTLDDLRRNSSTAEYRRALRQAEYLRLPLDDAARADADGTRSGLEAEFLSFCKRHRLPTPEVNARIGPFTVDFLWRRERVVVETDSYRTHGGAVAFEEDRKRDLWLKTHRHEVVRVTDRRLGSDPHGLAISLRAILARAVAA